MFHSLKDTVWWMIISTAPRVLQWQLYVSVSRHNLILLMDHFWLVIGYIYWVDYTISLLNPLNGNGGYFQNCNIFFYLYWWQIFLSRWGSRIDTQHFFCLNKIGFMFFGFLCYRFWPNSQWGMSNLCYANLLWKLTTQVKWGSVTCRQSD